MTEWVLPHPGPGVGGAVRRYRPDPSGAPGQLWTALLPAGVFGWAFMTLTGLYLVTGIRLLRERPSMGPVVPFLAITVGQVVGVPLGWIGYGRRRLVEAVPAFATLALLIATAPRLFPRPSPGAVTEDATEPPFQRRPHRWRPEPDSS